MILPTKHIRLSESLLGLSGYLLRYLHEPLTVDELWFKFSKINNSKTFPAYHSFDNMILALDCLYMINKIEINSEGKIYVITGAKS